MGRAVVIDWGVLRDLIRMEIALDRAIQANDHELVDHFFDEAEKLYRKLCETK